MNTIVGMSFNVFWGFELPVNVFVSRIENKDERINFLSNKDFKCFGLAFI
jgi:hypothetical protein